MGFWHLEVVGWVGKISDCETGLGGDPRTYDMPCL